MKVTVNWVHPDHGSVKINDNTWNTPENLKRHWCHPETSEKPPIKNGVENSEGEK